MYRIVRQTSVILLVVSCIQHAAFAQKDSVPVIAGQEYARGFLHRWLWGSHYRKEWAATVSVPIIMLDTAGGGLKPYEAGGGRQSKSLRLRNPREKEYVLRSINKSFGRALPEIYQGSFVEHIVNDQVSIGHPYSALTISPLAEAAGIYHTIPEIGFVPAQPALDTFNNEFGNTLFLLEQRPDENWEEAANFGHSKKIIGTDKLFEKLTEDNDDIVDQKTFLRARLFDMVIGDWGRHEDQWRWAGFGDGERTIYKAIPRDRDQAYTKFDGLLVRLLVGMAGLGHLQTFNEQIKNVNEFNYPARNLDRRLLNEPALEDWLIAAKELQAALTYEVVENAVKQLPSEVYPISGPGIISKLDSRIQHLQEYAKEYYLHLAKKVQVAGSQKREYFDVKRLNDDETSVQIFKINKKGELEGSPIFSRIFKTSETNEIRIFGLDGNDIYHVEGKVQKGIKIRLIGGPARDSIINTSLVEAGKRKTEVYDDHENYSNINGYTKFHFSSDTSARAYHYDTYTPDKKGIKIVPLYYSNEDRIYGSIGYRIRKNQWRKYPFAYEHQLNIHYSYSQQDYSVWYSTTVNQLFGKWNLALNADYDNMHWMNYYGAGNESPDISNNTDYYRMQSTEWYGGAGVNRKYGDRTLLNITGFYQKITIINDPERFIAKNFSQDDEALKPHSFAGARLDYFYQDVNNIVVPTKGINFAAGVNYTKNLTEPTRSIVNFSGTLNSFLPLIGKLGLAMRTSGATVSGEPEFYQLNWIGGSNRLRGYSRERFFGKTAFFNNAELQWITNFNSVVFNGKIGLIAFYDAGRVWMPHENSNTWHSGYGGGILLAPFNKISFSVSYGISEENKLLHIRINRPLF